MKKKCLLIILLNFGFLNLLLAQTWDGSQSTDWNTPANWNTNAVPLPAGNVIIPAGLSTYPVLASNVVINSIDMKTGSQLDVNGFTLTIDGASAYIYFTGATLNNSNAGTDIVININTGAGGFFTSFRSNTVNDNITFNLTGTNQFNEAEIAASANTYNGNCNFNINGAMPFYLSHLSPSNFNGNLTVSRFVAGSTQFFNGGANITGNFSYTNNTTGVSTLGNLAIATTIAGTVNIAANYTSNNTFTIHRLINQTSGGIINIQNTTGFDIQKDTLKVVSLSVTGYKTGQYGYLLNNAITGNVTLADDAGYTGGFYTQIRNNTLTGTSSFTNNGSNVLYAADVLNSSNTYNGNTSFTGTNSGALSVSNGSASNFNGNLTVNRSAAGSTQFFNVGAIISGNFSYSNNSSGVSSFGNNGFATTIGGTVNIAAIYTSSNTFTLQRLINQTAGGSINIQNTTGFDIQKDTLKVVSLSVTGFKTGQYGYLLNNVITGNVTIADDVSYTGGFYTQIRNNIITGTSSFANNGTNVLYASDVPNSSNTYNGNSSFTATNSGALSVSNGSTSNFNGNLTVNRTGVGITQFFNAGAAIAGNFSYINNTSGASTFGNLNFATTISGTVNIAANYTTSSTFFIYRLINQTAGGSINLQNTTGFDIQKDTLKVVSLSVTGYKTGQYGNLINNEITGNVTIADDATYTGGFYTLLRTNKITGNSSFTNNGSNVLYDADVVNTGNIYIGNVTYVRNGGGTITVAAASINEITQNLTLNSSSGISLGKIKFNGATGGMVEQLGTQAILISEATMEKTGAGNVTLNDSLSVGTNFTFNGGNIISSETKQLKFLDNAVHSGSSVSSKVVGKVTKVGNDIFTFPTGTATSLNVVSMTAPATVSSVFGAEYFKKDPALDGYDTAQHAISLKKISGCEYWDVKREIGSSNVTLTFTYAAPCAGNPIYISNPAEVRIAHWTGATWEDLGNGGSTGTTTGTVSTAGPVVNFSPFTFGSTNLISNPLPISLLYFAAVKNSGKVQLRWQTSNEINASHFEIEKSNDGSRFSSLTTVNAANLGGRQDYTSLDALPSNGKNYYRLKMVDADGRFKYSQVIVVDFKTNAGLVVFPNPASDVIKIYSDKLVTTLEFLDIQGRLLKQLKSTPDNSYNINDLLKGVYFIRITTKEGTEILRFLKQ